MKFSFKAQRIATNEVFDGVAEAPDKFSLAKNLKAEGKLIISATPMNESGFSITQFIQNILSRISLKEKIFFANNLAEMISAGLTLTRALSVLERQSTNKTFKDVITSVVADVNSGGSFGTALRKFPKVFSPIFIAMVEAGERSGRLPESLKIVSEQMQKSYALTKKIKGALIYPAVIICAMIGIAILMMIFVVPTLATTFEDIGADLPITTRFLIGTSSFFVNHGILALLIAITLAYAFFRLLKTAKGKRAWDALVLRLPVFKGIVQEMNSAITARTISSLVSSGVDIVESLRITGRVLQNVFYQEVIERAVNEVPKGRNLSEIFAEAPKLYPIFVPEIMEVGEETGKMSEMMMKLAIFYENEVDAITKDLSTIIEPLIMLLVGAGVGFFALSMIQPIYSIGTAI